MQHAAGKGGFLVQAGLFGQRPAQARDQEAVVPEGLQVEAERGLEAAGEGRGQDQGAQGVEAQAQGGVFDAGGFAGAAEARRVGQAQHLGGDDRVTGHGA